jgi:hypothetical protein
VGRDSRRFIKTAGAPLSLVIYNFRRDQVSHPIAIGAAMNLISAPYVAYRFTSPCARL